MENSVINPDLCTVMEKMEKFRNVLVHQYEDVDAEIVIVILAKHLNDFERDGETILAYLNRTAS